MLHWVDYFQKAGLPAKKADSGETLEQLQAENARLKEAIRRLAEQDATLSVCDGNVTVTVDNTLTDAEREAIGRASDTLRYLQADYGKTQTEQDAATLRGLLERTAQNKTDGYVSRDKGKN